MLGAANVSRPDAMGPPMPTQIISGRLSSDDLKKLEDAVHMLEGTSFAARMTNLLGAQVEAIGRALPASVKAVAARASEAALKAALRVAIATIDDKAPKNAARGMHKLAAAASGAVGGAFGFAAVPVELPVSTTIMLRSIAQIAREEGEDLSAPEARLACVEVFALGGRAPGEAAFETGYFAIRAALARSVSESVKFVAQKSAVREGAPALVRLVSQVAARFGLVVSEKLAAQAIPVVGALGGAAINLAFIQHFQTMARGHFIVRRLEREYGAELVQFEYRRVQNAAARAPEQAQPSQAGA